MKRCARRPVWRHRRSADRARQRVPAGARGGPEGWSVSPRDEVERALQEAAGEIAAAGVEVTTYARQGDPAAALLDVAEERRADLIVVGNKGMTGADRFLLGSVPNKVTHHAPCSVLVIRV